MRYNRAIQELITHGLVTDYGVLTDKGRRVLRTLSDRARDAEDGASGEEFVMTVSALVR